MEDQLEIGATILIQCSYSTTSWISWLIRHSQRWVFLGGVFWSRAISTVCIGVLRCGVESGREGDTLLTLQKSCRKSEIFFNRLQCVKERRIRSPWVNSYPGSCLRVWQVHWTQHEVLQVNWVINDEGETPETVEVDFLDLDSLKMIIMPCPSFLVGTLLFWEAMSVPIFVAILYSVLRTSSHPNLRDDKQQIYKLQLVIIQFTAWIYCIVLMDNSLYLYL